MSEEKEVKEKLIKILNSKITKTFLDNITKPLGDKTVKHNVISRQDSVNCFLYNVFMNDDVNDSKIYVEDLNHNNKINNLIINEQRINIKTLSNTSKRIFFNGFSYKEGNEFNIELNLKNTMDKLKNFNYFLFIIIFRSTRQKEFKIKYDFYLKPTKDFYFNSKIYHKTSNGFAGENWEIKSNSNFFFFIDNYGLGHPIFTYEE